MTKYIDIWTGFHLWLSALGFMFFKYLIILKWDPYEPLFYVTWAVIGAALLYELIFDVLRWKKYKSFKRCLINTFFDMVAAFASVAACLIIEGIFK